MKKIFISFLLGAVALFTALRVEAMEPYTVYDDVTKFTSLVPMESGTTANIMRGISNPEDIYNDELYSIYTAPVDCGLNGNVTIRNNYRYGRDIVIFKSVVTYEAGKLTHLSYNAGEELIYDLSIAKTNGEITVNVCKEYHPIDIFKRVEPRAYLDDNLEVSFNFDGTEDEGALEDFYMIDLSTMGFTLLRGGVVKYNSAYEGKDVHMAVEMDNAMPINELLKNISIKDDTEGVINDYMVLDTTYKPVNGKCPVGVYSLRILAKDSKGHAVIQDVSINVIDAKGPSLTIEDFYIDYDARITELAVKNAMKVTDSTADGLEVVIDLSQYTPHSAVLGDYPYSVTVTDKYGNSTTKTATIHVLDRKAPTIVVKDLTVTYPYALLSDDEIKAAITANDGLDGPIAKASISLTDLDNYKTNHDKLGSYRVRASVSDKSGNEATAIINILVVDEDYPEITIGSTIVVSAGEVLSRERIIELLKQMGEIPADAMDVTLESLYFTDERPSGKYELRVGLPDGREIIETISVNEDNSIYDGPEIKPKESNYLALYIGGGIASAVGIAIAAIFVVVYRKKH